MLQAASSLPFVMRSERQPESRAAALAAVLIGALGAALMAVRLLVPVPVGMANNGDGARLFCQLGARTLGPPEGSAQWDFVRFVYEAASPGVSCRPYESTQILQLHFTAWLHDLLGGPGVLDMRSVIVQDSLLTGVAIGTFAWLLREARLWVRIALPAAMLLVLADATFADYAASPFSEPAAFIGLVTVALAGVAVVSGKRRRTAFVVAAAGAVLAVGAKTGMATLALPIALLLGSRRLPIGRPRSRVLSGLTSRALPALSVAALAVTIGWMVSSEPPWFEKINVANEVTMTIMPLSDDPAQVAEDLGLPPSFGRYSGSHWWSPEPIHRDPEYRAYQDKISRSNLLRYFAENPGMSFQVLTSGADDYLRFRIDYLGTYGDDAGTPPGAQECRVCVLPTVSRALSWTGFPGVATYWLACLLAAAVLIRRSAPGTPRRAFALVAMTLMSCTILQYLTSVFGEGNEVTKHLAVALLAATLAPLWLLAALLTQGDPTEEPEQPTAATEPMEPTTPTNSATGL